MPSDSVQAYDAPQRVHKYDADMDIMHPLRHEMIEIALDVLPFESLDDLKVLDLGSGTGAFALRILERYPNSTVVAIDGSSSMLELAQTRLQEKLAALRSVVPAIKPGGWVLNADIVVANHAVVEQRIQEIRVEAVAERAPADDERFTDPVTTRAHLDQLEANEQDQPLTLTEDLQILREAGIENAEVF